MDTYLRMSFWLHKMVSFKWSKIKPIRTKLNTRLKSSVIRHLLTRSTISLKIWIIWQGGLFFNTELVTSWGLIHNETMVKSYNLYFPQAIELNCKSLGNIVTLPETGSLHLIIGIVMFFHCIRCIKPNGTKSQSKTCISLWFHTKTLCSSNCNSTPCTLLNLKH